MMAGVGASPQVTWHVGPARTGSVTTRHTDRPRLREPARRPTLRWWKADGVEFVSGSGDVHGQSRHRHDGFVVAIVEDGCEVWSVMGARRCLRRGQVLMLGPDIAHDVRPIGGGGAFRRLHVPVPVMRALVAAVGQRSGAAPLEAVGGLIADDPVAADMMLSIHRRAECCAGGAAIAALTARVIVRLAERRVADVFACVASPDQPASVARVRAMIDAAPELDYSLGDLAAAAGLSRFHFLRCFRRAAGQTPHADQVSRRVNAARRMLATGGAPADVAVACGFADQSHLTRLFRRLLGVTPGAYARGMRGVPIVRQT